jgi:dCTP diphosphatase
LEEVRKMKSIETLTQEIREFVKERDWDQFHSIKNLAMALSVESSELVELFQWMPESESNDVKNNPIVLPKLQDEIADVFVYLLRIADKAEIDIERAVRGKMKKNAEKYPADKVRGSSKKYTEY